VVDDLRGEVDSWQDRGLLGMTLDPNFPTNPYVYLLYAYDAPPGQTAPYWNDTCTNPVADGCMITGKLVRLTVSSNNAVTATKVLISGQWCQQFESHSIADLNFGPDGYLYVSSGEGSDYNSPVDFGQKGGSPGSSTPANPCGDPPSPAGTPEP